MCIDALGVLKQQQATTAERHMEQAASAKRQVAALNDGLARVQAQLQLGRQQQQAGQWQMGVTGDGQADGEGSNATVASLNGTMPDPWQKS